MGRKPPPSFEGHAFARLEQVVTTLVEAGLRDRATAPPNLIERLSEMERHVIEAGGDRQSLQVIASGRRLLDNGGTSNRPPSSACSAATDTSS